MYRLAVSSVASSTDELPSGASSNEPNTAFAQLLNSYCDENEHTEQHSATNSVSHRQPFAKSAAASLHSVVANIDVLRHLLTCFSYTDTSMLCRACNSVDSSIRQVASFDALSLEYMPPVSTEDAPRFFLRWPLCRSWNVLSPPSDKINVATFHEGEERMTTPVLRMLDVV
jgi:hypothetical protein